LFKIKPTKVNEFESLAELLVEQYLPRVLHYVNYWVKDTCLAEELTIQTLKQALASYTDCCNNENTFSVKVFVIARQEILSHFQIRSFNPALPNLSLPEQEVLSLKLGALLDNPAIARILGLSESSVSSIIFQSLSKLSAKLEVAV
jgi:DNA-directed RNA polymerase specialized sigma24 family protein